MKLLCLLISLAFNTVAFAGASGYVHQGTTVYLYKDGKVVPQKISRGPASTSAGKILFFTEDEFARCYYWEPKDEKKPEKNIHCIKKSELK